MSQSTSEQPFQLKVIPVTQLQQNAMIFWSSQSMTGVLIDPGGEVDRLLAEIEQTKVRITQIWITHGHVDHVGGAAKLRQQLGCDIVGPHLADQFLLDELYPGLYDIADAEKFTPDRYLEDGDTLEFEGLTFSVLHCPGHSPGHVVFYQPQLNFAFVGDVLFKGSIGRTDLPGGNHQELIESIVEKLWPLGLDIQFAPGHGPGSTFREERNGNPFVADHVLDV